MAPKWQGRCSRCGEWNSLEAVSEGGRGGGSGVSGVTAGAAVTPTLLSDVDPAQAIRRPSGLGECDRVLGGGIVPGSLVLLGGDPGIGKSTLALALARRVGTPTAPALYCSGEESAAQVAMRARRVGCAGPEVAVVAETDVDVLCSTLEARRPPLAVVDSVQTLLDPQVAGAPGSVSQVREAVGRLLLCAKSTGVAVLLIGHVTKDGAIAGPRTLEHLVDVVLYLEGDRYGEYRLLRGVKNRFGATDELGVLVLGEKGISEPEAPARAFLDEVSLQLPGSALTVVCEGSRPMAVEVQALVVPTAFGLPRRTAAGFDVARLHLLLAVLERRGGIPLGQADVYVNAVGGMRLVEPAADLAVALAVASAARDRPLPQGHVVVGEVGLGGEVRRVRRLASRLTEAASLGMRGAVVPAPVSASEAACLGAAPGGSVRPVSHLREALAVLA